MARRETVELEYVAKIDKLERELSKLPGISDKEAKKLVKGLDRELKRATKAAKAAARSQRDAWSRAGEGAEGFKRIADAAGGSAAGAAGKVSGKPRLARWIRSDSESVITSYWRWGWRQSGGAQRSGAESCRPGSVQACPEGSSRVGQV